MTAELPESVPLCYELRFFKKGAESKERRANEKRSFARASARALTRCALNA